MADFALSIEWEEAEGGPAEIRETTGRLTIDVDGHSLTRCRDAFAKSVRSSIRVSAYPLALWFASNWWRLRWEPGPSSERDVDPGWLPPAPPEWRMAHDIPAAGCGYFWPLVRFTSSGRIVQISSQPSEENESESVAFLESRQGFVSAATFERAIDDFVGLVRNRLECVGVASSELSQLWSEVCDERHDPDLVVGRRIEAMLGFDPDELPSQVASSFLQRQGAAGTEAICEVAAGFSRARGFQLLDEIVESAERSGIDGHLNGIRSELRSQTAPSPLEQPWQFGWRLADGVRRYLGVGDGPVPDRILTECLGLRSLDFAPSAPSGSPVSLALRADSDSDEVRFAFRKRFPTGRRFEAARFLADWLTAPESDVWLVAADAATYRQRLQRSFAAEFLCPIQSLRDWMHERDADPNDTEAIEDAGRTFSVSPLLVRSHLANHGDVDPF